MRFGLLRASGYAAATFVVVGCAGRVVSIGNNTPPSVAVDTPSTVATATACQSGYAHPNICCAGSTDPSPQCTAWADTPFYACGAGQTTFPDPTLCCSLTDPTSCISPGASAVQPGISPSDAETCTYACAPGSWPSTIQSSGDGSFGTVTECCQQDDRGGVVCDPAPTISAGTICSCPAEVADAAPCVCDAGAPTVQGASCNVPCPSGWSASIPSQPEVCCRQAADGTEQCFSQATGLFGSNGASGDADAGEAVTAVDVCQGDNEVNYEGTMASCAPYVCKVGVCLVMCTSVSDCIDGFVCNASNECVASTSN